MLTMSDEPDSSYIVFQFPFTDRDYSFLGHFAATTQADEHSLQHEENEGSYLFLRTETIIHTVFFQTIIITVVMSRNEGLLRNFLAFFK